MANNKIQIKRSSVSGRVPTALQLDVGEFAVNLVDNRLFTKNASNTVIEVLGQSLNTTANVSFTRVETGNVVTSQVDGNGSLVLNQSGAGGFVVIKNNGFETVYTPSGSVRMAGPLVGSSYDSNQVDASQTAPLQLRGLLYGVQLITSPDNGSTSHVWSFGTDGTFDVPSNVNANGTITANTFVGNIDWSYVTSKPDLNIEITGDATGNTTFTDLANGSINVTLANTAVTAGTYGNSSVIPVITVDSKGRITSATTNAVAGITGYSYADANNTFSITAGDGSVYEATINTVNSLSVSSNLVVTGVGTFANDVSITGNLTVLGVTSFVNTTQLDIGDNIITLNADTSGAPVLNAGIEIARGDSANVSLLWNETSETWTFSNDGTTFLNIASNTDVNTAYSNAISFATDKAANAYSNAVSFATSAAANAYSNAVSFTTSAAANAYSNAASYADAKAANAYSNAASYADTKAATAYSNAASYADTKSAAAYSNAVSVAATDATNKAANAYSNAVSTASADATTKTSTAYSNAVSVAATDATTKANAAYANAVSYADVKAANAYSNAVSTAATDATDKAANAYSNAVSFATSAAANAYSNAVLYIDTAAATSYSNAVIYAASVATAAFSNAAARADAAYANAIAYANSAATQAYVNAAAYVTVKAYNAYTNAVSYSDTISATAYSNAVSTAAADATTKAATAYSNAASYADTVATTAYNNAVTFATNKAANAYANAIAYAASNTYVNTQLGLKANSDSPTFTGTVAFSSNIALSNTRISANGSNGTAGQVLTSGGAGGNVYWSTVTSSNGVGTTYTLTTAANTLSANVILTGADSTIGNVKFTGNGGINVSSNGSVITIDGNSVLGGGGNAFGTIAVSGQANVVADQANDILTFVAGSNMTITTNAAGDTITFAASGSGGGGTTGNSAGNAFISGRDNFVGDGTTTAFTLSQTATANSILVLAEGLVQFHNEDYDVSGTTLTFTTAPANNERLEIVYISGASTYHFMQYGAIDTFTGNGSNTAYTLSRTANTSTATVYLDGLLQAPTADFSLSGSTLTFTSAPLSGEVVLVYHTDSVSSAVPGIAISGTDSFTGDGTTASFTVSSTANNTSSVVSINGIMQRYGVDYSISDLTLSFVDAPPSGSAVQAMRLSGSVGSAYRTVAVGSTLLSAPATDSTLTFANTAGVTLSASNTTITVGLTSIAKQSLTGNGSNTQFTLTYSATSDDLFVYVNGIYFHPDEDYTVADTTLTFITAPADTSQIRIRFMRAPSGLVSLMGDMNSGSGSYDLESQTGTTLDLNA